MICPFALDMCELFLPSLDLRFLAAIVPNILTYLHFSSFPSQICPADDQGPPRVRREPPRPRESHQGPEKSPAAFGLSSFFSCSLRNLTSSSWECIIPCDLKVKY